MKTRLLLPLALSLVGACASMDDQSPPAAAPEALTPAPVRSAERQALPSTPAAPSRTAAARAKMGAPGQASVYFDYDTYDIKPEFRAVIEQNAKYLRENAAVEAKIEGNADERGSREYNLALGQRRAEAVMKMMVLLGVPEKRMEAVSVGEEKPRRTGHDEPSWAENRRSDLVVQPAK